MKPSKPSGQVRIIGGRWRGSKLPVLERPGLRPSSDRVRETLFNWLQGELHGRRCLDLFAGSGALGFEAASRGAGHVLMIERDAGLAASLRASAERLRADNIEVRCADALYELERLQPGFDLVFLDPPFAAQRWTELLPRLAPRLTAEAWIYIEVGSGTTLPLPPNWRLHRQGRTQQVDYALYRCTCD